MDRVLNTAYYDYANPEWFGGVKKLATSTKVPYHEAKHWLMSQDTYTLHKPVQYKFSRRTTLLYGINDLWQCDLVDLQHLAEHNNGIRFLLTITDVFSEYAYVILLKNKTSVDMRSAFEKLFQKVKPKNLQSDKGKEFYNAKLQSLFKKYNINHYSEVGDHKVSLIERFNKTLKNKMFMVFTYRKSYKHDDILQSLVKSYNDSEHRSIGMPPSSVTRNIKSEENPKQGFLPGWSDEVFSVSKVHFAYPTTYELQDLKAEAIKGPLYAEELQKISKLSDYRTITGTITTIERLLAYRTIAEIERQREDRIIKTSESFVRFNHKYTDMDNMHHELFQHINFNLMQTGIRGAADFLYDFKEDKVEISIQRNMELEFRLLHALIFMRMLSMTKDVVLTENNKVKIHIPYTSQVTFQDELRDLLGFKNSTLHGGIHISDYQMELDGGITEIYFYSDIIESHFVGDTIAPLLHIIPVMSMKEDQIVVNYLRPMYFPLCKNYIDFIEIELKSSS
ncbi:uncharacterized transposon-derived protein F54H12.3 [Nephila pilipes]|uniref:Uncharacterized transposon-derived protein F54H12.3 n=1 Tax=Nephila pilipes TaxID=299642 RepID=A0A8X6MQ83_NEPPI|nr:uncharacterized transposon-derived protein F54H12.3 [Nephila pilipes]